MNKNEKDKKMYEAQENEISNEHEAENNDIGGSNVELDNDTVDTEKEVLDLKDRLLRVMAEFDNFKKRAAKEKEDLYSLAVCETVSAILPVLDNLDRAIAAANNESNAFADGVRMVQKQFMDAISTIGVEPIPSVGEKFNPDIHNAVMHEEDENFDENVIVEEFVKGYTFKGRVVRHSMIKVVN